MANMKQKIRPFLWFDKECEEAMKFYVDVFNAAPYSKKNSKIVYIARYEKGIETPQGPEMEGKVLTGEFELAGQKFMCLDGGPIFKFNESVSFFVECEDQDEVDYFWGKRMMELLGDEDKEKSHRVANAMLKMKKINIKDLENASKG